MKRKIRNYTLPEDRDKIPRWVLVACMVLFIAILVFALSGCASTARVDPFDKMIEEAGVQLFSPQLEGGAL